MGRGAKDAPYPVAALGPGRSDPAHGRDRRAAGIGLGAGWSLRGVFLSHNRGNRCHVPWPAPPQRKLHADVRAPSAGERPWGGGAEVFQVKSDLFTFHPPAMHTERLNLKY